MADHIPSRVRAFLRAELPRWRAEGIVDAQGADALTRRYLAEPEGTGAALAALYVLAAAMVGAGIISLVAAHWEDLPRSLRLAALGAALVAAHGTGFWMWRIDGRWPRLGHAISLLGTLVFGASIGLVAQIFHVSGAWYGFFGAWALGALAAGLALPSLPSLGLSVVLGLHVWAPGYLFAHPKVSDVGAWLAGGAALALAFAFRSRALFVLATLGLAAVLGTAAAALPARSWAEVLQVFATIVAMSAAASAFGAFRWRGEPHRFAPAAASLGRILFYVLSFGITFEAGARMMTEASPSWGRAWSTCVLPPLVLAPLLLAVPMLGGAGRWERLAAGWIPTAFAALFTAMLFGYERPATLALVANVAMLALAGVRIVHGLRTRRRGPFWEGLAIAAVVGCARFIEIDQRLWLKGLGFIACGVGVTVAAVLFEKRLQKGAEVHHA